jgi:hypothetical protein
MFLDDNNKIYENDQNSSILNNEKIVTRNTQILNDEFSLGNKNDIEKNFNLNNELDNTYINNFQNYSQIKVKEGSQQKFYNNDSQDQKHFINTNNTFNNDYIKHDENQFYNNMNSSNTKQSNYFHILYFEKN